MQVQVGYLVNNSKPATLQLCQRLAGLLVSPTTSFSSGSLSRVSRLDFDLTKSDLVIFQRKYRAWHSSQTRPGRRKVRSGLCNPCPRFSFNLRNSRCRDSSRSQVLIADAFSSFVACERRREDYRVKFVWPAFFNPRHSLLVCLLQSVLRWLVSRLQ